MTFSPRLERRDHLGDGFLGRDGDPPRWRG